MPRGEVIGADCFVWKGEVVCPGQILECSEKDAHALVNGYGTGRYVGAEPAPTRPGMVVNPDPEPEHRDPVVEDKPRRRRK